MAMSDDRTGRNPIRDFARERNVRVLRDEQRFELRFGGQRWNGCTCRERRDIEWHGRYRRHAEHRRIIGFGRIGRRYEHVSTVHG
jgi:hypothetical protein